MKMPDHEATYDVIFVFGPPVPNKEKYLPPTSLAPSHKILCLENIFQENPSFGLRDIALLTVANLKKHNQVLLIDDFRLRATRDSLIKIISRKIPSCRVQLVQVLPLYGYQQLMWQWQFAYAEGYTAVLKDESIVKNWFDVSTDNIDYESGYVEKPSEDEKLNKMTVNYQLEIETAYKLSIPVLFIQWQSELFNNEENKLQLMTICSKWISHYTVGRVIFICDSFRKTGDVSFEFFKVKEFIKWLSLKINTPVYAAQLDPLSSQGSFCLPPSPGIIAFLYQRHSLNLQSKGTCYIYETNDHMQMAQSAGIRNIKMSTFIDSSDILTTLQMLGATPAVPKFLRRIKVQETSLNACSKLFVPFYEQRLAITDGCYTQNCPQGIQEHIFVQDLDTFCKYQKEFVNQIQSRSTRSDAKNCKTKPLMAERLASSDQRLPIWMKPKTHSESSGDTLKRKHTASLESHYRSSKTVYFLTESELMEAANNVLVQADEDQNV
ncbi:CAunnamed protein product [Biomphalaria glabrata]|nr:CAunnamed protein product [Biomphalaria glabrata]